MKAVLTVCHEKNEKSLSPGENGAVALGIEEAKKRISRFKKVGADVIVLAGGEPTIHPFFFGLASAVREAGLNLGLITNGRMLCYSNFAAKYASYNPVFTQIVIYSHDREVHDAIAGVDGAFAQTLSGVRNIAGVVGGVEICIPVSLFNMNDIGRVPDIAAELGLPTARIKYVISIRDASAPEIAAASQAVSRAISGGLKKRSGESMTFRWEGFAPCLMPNCSELGADSLSEEMAFVWKLEEDNFSLAAGFARGGAGYDECIVCSRCPRCFPPSGTLPERAFIENTPNAAGYEFVRTLRAKSSPFCPAGTDVCSGLHPLLDIAVLSDGFADVYNHDGSCGASELFDVKFRREQVYLNVSGLSRNLDFRKAFRKARLHDRCRKCARPGARSGVFLPIEGNAFKDVEENEKAWLSALKGNTLDIGCGKPLFPELLQGKVRAGEISYLGVDTYPELSGELKTVAIDFEDFQWDGPLFDNVLMLRSYNHFKDPRLVMKKAASLLKTGGVLRVCDNALFAMLKKDVEDNPSEHSRHPYQHFRNHCSEDALKLLSVIDEFEVMEHTPIELGGANQWFIVLRKKQLTRLVPQ